MPLRSPLGIPPLKKGGPFKGVYIAKFQKIWVRPYRPKNCSKSIANCLKRGREGFQRHRTARSSVLVEYEPVGTHLDPIPAHFHKFPDTFKKTWIHFGMLLGLGICLAPILGALGSLLGALGSLLAPWEGPWDHPEAPWDRDP